MVTVKPNWKEFMDANQVNFTSFSSRSDLERFLHKCCGEKNIFHKATERKADVKSLLCISMVVSIKTLLKKSINAASHHPTLFISVFNKQTCTISEM